MAGAGALAFLGAFTGLTVSFLSARRSTADEGRPRTRSGRKVLWPTIGLIMTILGVALSFVCGPTGCETQPLRSWGLVLVAFGSVVFLSGLALAASAAYERAPWIVFSEPLEEALNPADVPVDPITSASFPTSGPAFASLDEEAGPAPPRTVVIRTLKLADPPRVRRPWNRASILTSIFVGAFAAIAVLATVATFQVSDLRFAPAVSQQMYAIAFAVALGAAIALGAIAGQRGTRLDGILHGLDLRAAVLRGATGADGILPLRNLSRAAARSDRDIDSVLDTVDSLATDTFVDVERRGPESLVDVPRVTERGGERVRVEVLYELMRQREIFREARAKTWAVAAGPVLTAVVLLALAGVLFPIAPDFAVENVRLNTMVLLIMTAGWALLLIWVAVAILVMFSASQFRAEESARTAADVWKRSLRR